MEYPYFKGLEADRYSFYRVPKALVKADLFQKMSGDAKLLYVPEQPWYIRALTVQECEQLDVLLEQKEEYVILWKTFFDSICIHERRNDSLQTNMAPKKYRTHMTEFQPEQQ